MTNSPQNITDWMGLITSFETDAENAVLDPAREERILSVAKWLSEKVIEWCRQQKWGELEKIARGGLRGVVTKHIQAERKAAKASPVGEVHDETGSIIPPYVVRRGLQHADPEAMIRVAKSLNHEAVNAEATFTLAERVERAASSVYLLNRAIAQGGGEEPAILLLKWLDLYVSTWGKLEEKAEDLKRRRERATL